jgi:hypothetical protein
VGCICPRRQLTTAFLPFFVDLFFTAAFLVGAGFLAEETFFPEAACFAGDLFAETAFFAVVAFFAEVFGGEAFFAVAFFDAPLAF